MYFLNTPVTAIAKSLIITVAKNVILSVNFNDSLDKLNLNKKLHRNL